MKKIAVILMNLGAPNNDKIEDVESFLFALFYDPAIIRMPNPFRYLLAKFLAKTRCKNVQENYRLMGGRSPLLENTKKQANALEALLQKNNENRQNDEEDCEYKVLIAMRYYQPLSTDAVAELKIFSPTNIILLPLYPQYSSTTSGSSIEEWFTTMHNEVPRDFFFHKVNTVVINSYYNNEKFINAHCDLIEKEITKFFANNKKLQNQYIEQVNNEKSDLYPVFRILFSAHGLPEKIARLDPYEEQIKATVNLIINRLYERKVVNINKENFEYIICYQSKVGPLPWLKPSTEHEIVRAINDQMPMILVPVAFVSEHSETLVELDIEYKELVLQSQSPDLPYMRVPTLDTHSDFIECLADLCQNATSPQKKIQK